MLNVKDNDLGQIKRDLIGKGFSFLNSHVPKGDCERIKSFIDAFPDTQSEINYAGTEKRIWSAQEHYPELKEFSAFADRLLSDLFASHAKAKTVLAYRNLPVASDPDLIQGRWHLDSLRPQYKVFCFLTRTTASSGPLEVVPGTQRAGFKWRPLLSGRLIAPTDIGTGNRRYQKLDDAWVQRECKRLGGPEPLLCEAGSVVVVDTSAIHRARPCLEANRYALCVYYGHF